MWTSNNLLPEALRESAFQDLSSPDDKGKSKKKKFANNSPADWSLAFSVYTAVAVHFQPEKAFQLAAIPPLYWGWPGAPSPHMPGSITIAFSGKRQLSTLHWGGNAGNQTSD